MIDLINKSETEGLDEDEAVTLAVYYVTTGLVNSTGSIGRFVDMVASDLPFEFEAALDAHDAELVTA